MYRVKKVIAHTEEAARELLKKELGEDVVILSTREIENRGLFSFLSRKKVEVTAANAPKQAAEKNLEDSLQGLKAFTQQVTRESQEQATLTSDQEKENSLDISNKRSSKKVEIKNSSGGSNAFSTSTATTTYADPRFNRYKESSKKDFSNPSLAAKKLAAMRSSYNQNQTQALQETTREESRRFNQQQSVLKDSQDSKEESVDLKKMTQDLIKTFGDTNGEIKKEESLQEILHNRSTNSSIDEIRSVIREEMRRAQKSVTVGSLEDNDEKILGSARFLMDKGVDRSIVLEIEQTLDQMFGKINMQAPSQERTQRINQLKELLKGYIQEGSGIVLNDRKAKFIAIVGPTGVGKTTTLAKLAHQFSIQEKKRVAILSLDISKVGASDQIRQLGRKVNAPVIVCATKQELDQKVKELIDIDLVLIDTSGCSQYKFSQVQELEGMLRGIPSLEVYLTVSATTKDLDVYGIVKHFSLLNPRSLIVTKLDETIAHGLLLNVCHKMKTTISYLSYGPRITHDLNRVNKETIARSILLEHNSQSCQEIRKIANDQ